VSCAFDASRARQPSAFASILAELNLPPRRAMYLLGHTDPMLTMRVYEPPPTGKASQPDVWSQLEGAETAEWQGRLESG
jgi:hypothetical protein